MTNWVRVSRFVNLMRPKPRWPVALVAVVVAALILACAGEPAPADAPTPSPTPVPDPAALLEETAANLRALESTKFVLNHEIGSIFVPAFSAKVTEASGVWDATGGADLAIDSYMVPDATTDPQSGIYFQLLLVVTSDSYYGTDPISGGWMKQPRAMAPIPVDILNEIIADLVVMIENPALADEGAVDGIPAYQIRGDAPATVMEWLLLSAGAGQSVGIELWTDKENRFLRKLRIIGPIGEYDQPGTVRELLLTGINEPVDIEPPTDYVDLSGG